MSGFLPFVFSMCANDVSAADSSVSLYFSRFSHLFRRFFIPLRPVVVMQYFSLLFKRESGWNPERYRHCMRRGTAHDESRSLGVDSEKAVRNAYDTQVRRPAQIVKVYLLSSYGEMGYFVAKKRQQQSCMTAAFFFGISLAYFSPFYYCFFVA